MLVSQQLIELGWRYNPAELRNEHGEWTKLGETVASAGKDYEHPDHTRLINQRGKPPDPADHPFFKAHPVSPENIMASYDRAPAATRQQGMRWYADAHVIAKAIAHGDADKGAGVLAAYSPQTGWPSNMMNAARALELGRAIGPGEGMITGSMQANAQKAMDGKAADVANSSSKTRAFARLIRNGGDMPDETQGEVVVDRHAMSVAMGQRITKKENDASPIGNDRFYQHVADQYREAAKRISERDGTPISPHQLQAITWLQQQEENENADAGVGGPREVGRATMMRNAWLQWDAKAKTEQIPTHAGTTMLDAVPNLISRQVMELAVWEHEPRDSRGRWTKFGGVGEAVKVMEKEREGFSVSPRTGEAPASGYMVALDGHTHRYPAEILDDPAKLHKAIDDMLMSERESFQGKDMYLGGWVEDGKLWLDPSQNVQNRATAEQLGRARDQVGIFDLNTFNTINTGGSGGGRIIDHANPAEGARGGPRELLGPARGGAPGGGGEDRRRYPIGIAAQLIDLGWDGWRTEPRDLKGRWTRLPGEAVARDVTSGEGYPGQFNDQILSLWRHETSPVARGALNQASAAYQGGDHKTAAALLRQAGHGDLAAKIDSGDTADKSSQAAVQSLMHAAADSVPGMFGPDEHLDWDGKPPTLFADVTQPKVLAEVGWNGHVSIAQSVASALAEAKNGGSISDTNAFTVPLHEMIHAVIPTGQHRASNGDKKAYQNYANAQIEEGFTELGTVQHAAEFFDQAGVGDRRVLDQGSLARQQHLAAINGLPFKPDLTATKTMDDLAAEVNDPARIRNGNVWGHYKVQTAQAYNWVSTIAQLHTGKSESSQATQDEILRLSDDVNAVGTAAKPRVMAQHVIADMGLSGATRESVLSSTAQTILGEWASGDVQQTVAQARKAALQRVQALRVEAERAAA
jgi:hypothetical protein